MVAGNAEKLGGRAATDFVKTGENGLTVTDAGNVRIGTTNPNVRLEVGGRNPVLRIWQDQNTPGEATLYMQGYGDESKKIKIIMHNLILESSAGFPGGDYLRIQNHTVGDIKGDPLAYFSATGNVGIGTSTEVTLVSRENFVLFTPMLHEVAAGDLDMTDIVCPLRKMLKRVRFLQAEVDEINVASRQVSLVFGVHREQRQLHYDYLNIALGSESNFLNVPGVEQRALTMKSLGDAFLLRNQALAMLEMASVTQDPSAKRAMLTFVIAGGGFAGVETVGALNDFVRDAIRYYPALDEKDLRVVLVNRGSIILPELNETLGRYAQTKLAARKIEIRAGTSVVSFGNEGVALSDGETVQALTLVWTAGGTSPAVLQNLPVKKEKGRIVVNEMLEAEGAPCVWAIGDSAWVPNGKPGQSHPTTAQHALREAVCCAKNVVATVRRSQKTPFRFKMLGQLATIGRHVGVAEVFGVRVSGFAAWYLWRTIYLWKLPTFEKKLRVVLKWTLDLMFPRDLTQHLTLHGIDRVGRLLAHIRQNVKSPVSQSQPLP